jgi:serralysin
LTGGAGSDTFSFNAAPGVANADDVTDFSHADDTIQLSRSVMPALPAAGPLPITAFALSTDAPTAADRIIYNAGTGALYYDADGNGATAAVLIANLDSGLAIDNTDFVIV